MYPTSDVVSTLVSHMGPALLVVILVGLFKSFVPATTDAERTTRVRIFAVVLGVLLAAGDYLLHYGWATLNGVAVEAALMNGLIAGIVAIAVYHVADPGDTFKQVEQLVQTWLPGDSAALPPALPLAPVAPPAPPVVVVPPAPAAPTPAPVVVVSTAAPATIPATEPSSGAEQTVSMPLSQALALGYQPGAERP